MLVVAALLAASATSRAGEPPEPAARDPVAGLSATSAAEREAALAALPGVLAKDPKAGARALPALKEILRTGSPAERAGAARVLLRVEGAEATATWLSRLDPQRETDERVLEAAVEGAEARAKDEALACALTAILRDASLPSARRALACEALGGFEGLVVGAVLSSPPPATDVTIEGCRALALGRRGGRESIPPLLDLLGHADASPRAHAWESLTRITGQRLPAARAPWVAWWAANEKAPLAPPPAASGGGDRERYLATEPAHVPRYYGIPLPRKGDSHVVFCLDTSQSMYGHGIERARRELSATVRDLTTGHLFDVVAFNDRVMTFSGRLARAHPVVKARVLAWIERLETLSYTNLYDAVETAFEYAGRGRHPAARPVRLDAVFVLSDGAPNRGRYHTHAQVVAGIGELSAKRVPVHTIGAGDEVFPLLRDIAAATGGTFVDAFE
jgi:hypothetical protein